jgi:hypothetical protein
MAYYVLICDSATFNFWEVANGGRKLEQRDGNEYAVVEPCRTWERLQLLAGAALAGPIRR